MATATKCVVFDIETNGLGSDATPLILTAFYYPENEYVIWERPHILSGMATFKGRLIIGFNVLSFDLPILTRFAIQRTPGGAMAPAGVYDLLDEIKSATGSIDGWSLANVLEATLGIRKSTFPEYSGENIPRLWHDGRQAAVCSYALTEMQRLVALLYRVAATGRLSTRTIASPTGVKSCSVNVEPLRALLPKAMLGCPPGTPAQPPSTFHVNGEIK